VNVRKNAFRHQKKIIDQNKVRGCRVSRLTRTWASEAGAGRGFGLPLTFSHQIFRKKGCFLSFGLCKMKLRHFCPLQKTFWPPLENPLLAAPWKKFSPRSRIRSRPASAWTWRW